MYVRPLYADISMTAVFLFLLPQHCVCAIENNPAPESPFEKMFAAY